MDTPLYDIFKGFEFPPVELELNTLLIEGNGPFNQVNYIDFLKSRSFAPKILKKADDFTCQHQGKYLIVGRRNWKEERILSLIANRAGQTLKIYSQEMFLSFLLTGNDPFINMRYLLSSFAIGHPALHFVSSLEYFNWPSTEVVGLVYGTSEFGWPQVGLLRHMGYRVGYSGQSELDRRGILTKIYNSPLLPQVNSQAYMDEWGKPKSALRLLKMADSIAAFCRLRKKNLGWSDRAIMEWESDLKWLHDTYYIGKYNFSWPQI